MLPFTCKSCGEQFDEEKELFKHLLSETHRGKKKLCPYCSESFRKKANFKAHMKENHSTIECQLCNCVFYSREFYQRHVEDSHIYTDWEEANIHLDGMEDSETIHELALRLQPDDDFYDTGEKIRRKIEHFMHHNTKYKNCRISLAGSAGKETAMAAQPDVPESDVDLVLFLGPYDVTTMEVFIRDVGEIMETLRQHIRNGDLTWARDMNLKGSYQLQCSIQFTVKCDDDDDAMKVDLLPAVDVLHGRYTDNAKRKVYKRMQNMSDQNRNYYNASLTELQLNLFRDVPDRLKGVIRIMKMWGKIIRKEEGFRVQSYFFELVVLHTWQKQGSPDDVSVALTVREVIHTLCFCPSLRIVWPEAYNFYDYIPEKQGPMVLDPANPYRDLAPSMMTAQVISRRAVEVLNNA